MKRGLSYLFFLSTVFLFLMVSIGFAENYVGAEACLKCHADEYNWWKTSGHPYKLRSAQEAKGVALPLPKGYSWEDISYVIGGYGWKARYMNREGYIITTAKDGSPAPTQYNIGTGRWVNYSPGEKKKYDCAGCHTAGYSKEGHQDGLEGIVGTWKQSGVTCEECHGPGGEHVARGGEKGTMKVERAASLCGRCHVRGDKSKIPAKGGFIQHHEQYNELLAGPHKALECVACHNPHKKARLSIKIECNSCHEKQAEAFTGSKMQKVGKTCIDCHMPMATKSAESVGHYEGDVRTHLFSIKVDSAAEMFYKEDAKEYARGYLTVEYACLDCHRDRDKKWALEKAVGVHRVGK